MRNKHIRTVFLLSTVLLFQYLIWIDSGGIGKLLDIRRKLAEKGDKVRCLQEQNQVISEDIKHLGDDDEEAIEVQARRDWGMIKEGERFYQVKQHEQAEIGK